MRLDRLKNTTHQLLAGGQLIMDTVATIVLPLVVLLCIPAIHAQVPSNYELCAKEAERCQFAGWRTVRYGANGIFAEKNAYNFVDCGVAAFGRDPVPNVLKSCYLVSPPAKNLSTFQMIFASDLQYPFCENTPCKDGPKDSKTANQWHSMAIGRLGAANPDIQGVVVNGDLTNTMRQEQIDVFDSLYASKYVIFPGLGNHDYQNYTAASNDTMYGVYDGNATSPQGTLLNLLQYFAKNVRGNYNIQGFDWNDSDYWNRSGSLAYYWDIGDYRFIQLNNFPAFAFKFSNYASRKVGNENYDIQGSLSWLKAVLRKSKNKNVVLNMHSINSSDGFGSFDSDSGGDYKQGAYSRPEWRDGAFEFSRILGENPNVVAIFAGHLHQYVGDQVVPKGKDGVTVGFTLQSAGDNAKYNRRNARNEVMPGQAVPVLFSGSAEYNMLLSVRFEPAKITAQPYRTLNGNPTPIGTATVIGGLDPAISAKVNAVTPAVAAARTITFRNEAGYVAKLSVVYFVNQNINGTQVPMPKALDTSALPLGAIKALEIPRDTVKGMPISVAIEGIGTTKGKVLDTTVPEGFNGNLCFKSWGTIFDAKGGACQ